MQGRPCRLGHPGGEADMRREPDHPGGVDHADDDGFFGNGKARKVSLGPDHRETAQIDRRTVGFISVQHYRALDRIVEMAW